MDPHLPLICNDRICVVSPLKSIIEFPIHAQDGDSRIALKPPVLDQKASMRGHIGTSQTPTTPLIIAYDIYKECCEGNLDPDWKCHPIDNQEQLLLQKLQCDPRYRMCPGDDAMRPSTQQATEERIGNQGSVVGAPIVPFTPKQKRKVSVPEDSTVTSCGVTAIHINNNREQGEADWHLGCSLQSLQECQNNGMVIVCRANESGARWQGSGTNTVNPILIQLEPAPPPHPPPERVDTLTVT